MAAEKYKNPELDRVLFPIFVQHGTVSAVFRHCGENGKSLTKPTLAKMASYFGWEKRRKEAVDQQSAAAPKTGNPLADLLIETRLQKERICKELQKSPANEGLNRIYGNLIKQELDILRDLRDVRAREGAALAVESVGKSGGLTPETVASLRASILGIKE